MKVSEKFHLKRIRSLIANTISNGSKNKGKL